MEHPREEFLKISTKIQKRILYLLVEYEEI